MESTKIEALLDAYFEGNTNLEEEKVLRDYFNNKTVASHLVQYKPIFVGLQAAQQERSSRAFQLPVQEPKKIKSWWYSVAALLVLALGVGIFYTSQPHLTQKEKEALAAFEKSRETMLLLSENLNKGAEQITFVNQFTKTKDKIFE
jgi:hypothetical protein